MFFANRDERAEIQKKYARRIEKERTKFNAAIKALGPKPPEPFGNFPTVAARTKAATIAVAWHDKRGKIESRFHKATNKLDDAKRAELARNARLEENALRIVAAREAKNKEAAKGRGSSSGSLDPF